LTAPGLCQQTGVLRIWFSVVAVNISITTACAQGLYVQKTKEIIDVATAAYNRYALAKWRSNLENHQIKMIHREQKCIVLFILSDFANRNYQLS
jgi:hypothetical protein